MKLETAEPCPGCGLVSPPVTGATHPYMLSSPGCWSLYGELLTFGEGRRVVDTYAVQHPGVHDRRAAQSVAIHLISVCATIERNSTPQNSVDLLRDALANPPGQGWPRLAPDPPVGTMTVLDVLWSAGSDRYSAAVAAWAEDLWAAYTEHHQTIRRWLDALGKGDD